MSDLSLDIKCLILTYAIVPQYKLISLAREYTGKLVFDLLCKNPRAIGYLKLYFERINWFVLSTNPSAISLLSKNLNRINWNNMCKNTNKKAIKLISDNIDKFKITKSSIFASPEAIGIIDEFFKSDPKSINWFDLSANPSDYIIDKYLVTNLDKVKWIQLATNSNPRALNLIKLNKHFDRWDILSTNPAAAKLLMDNLDRIDWGLIGSNSQLGEFILSNINKISGCDGLCTLSSNTSNLVLSWLETSPEFIDFYRLSGNPNPLAVRILLKYPHEIRWYVFSANPGLFVSNSELTNRLIKKIIKQQPAL